MTQYGLFTQSEILFMFSFFLNPRFRYFVCHQRLLRPKLLFLSGLLWQTEYIYFGVRGKGENKNKHN